jgi:hypothetical protein
MGCPGKAGCWATEGSSSLPVPFFILFIFDDHFEPVFGIAPGFEDLTGNIGNYAILFAPRSRSASVQGEDSKHQ